MNPFVYIPPAQDIKPLASTFGVKFSQDTFLTKNYLEDKKIPYNVSELENGPMGLCLRIKKEGRLMDINKMTLREVATHPLNQEIENGGLARMIEKIILELEKIKERHDHEDLS